MVVMTVVPLLVPLVQGTAACDARARDALAARGMDYKSPQATERATEKWGVALASGLLSLLPAAASAWAPHPASFYVRSAVRCIATLWFCAVSLLWRSLFGWCGGGAAREAVPLLNGFTEVLYLLSRVWYGDLVLSRITKLEQGAGTPLGTTWIRGLCVCALA